MVAVSVTEVRHNGGNEGQLVPREILLSCEVGATFQEQFGMTIHFKHFSLAG